jgi:hypothetical protein
MTKTPAYHKTVQITVKCFIQDAPYLQRLKEVTNLLHNGAYYDEKRFIKNGLGVKNEMA